MIHALAGLAFIFGMSTVTLWVSNESKANEIKLLEADLVRVGYIKDTLVTTIERQSADVDKYKVDVAKAKRDRIAEVAKAEKKINQLVKDINLTRSNCEDITEILDNIDDSYIN